MGSEYCQVIHLHSILNSVEQVNLTLSWSTVYLAAIDLPNRLYMFTTLGNQASKTRHKCLNMLLTLL